MPIPSWGPENPSQFINDFGPGINPSGGSQAFDSSGRVLIFLSEAEIAGEDGLPCISDSDPGSRASLRNL